MISVVNVLHSEHIHMPVLWAMNSKPDKTALLRKIYQIDLNRSIIELEVIEHCVGFIE